MADVDMQMRGYIAAVQNLELCDLQDAVGRFCRGEADVENPQFCPSSAQLCREVRRRLEFRKLKEEVEARRLAANPGSKTVFLDQWPKTRQSAR